jgi:hypothetical protein
VAAVDYPTLVDPTRRTAAVDLEQTAEHPPFEVVERRSAWQRRSWGWLLGTRWQNRNRRETIGSASIKIEGIFDIRPRQTENHLPFVNHTYHCRTSTAVAEAGSAVDHRIRGDFVVVQRWRQRYRKRMTAVDAAGVDLAELRHIALVGYTGLAIGSNFVEAVVVAAAAVGSPAAAEDETARSVEEPVERPPAVADHRHPADSTAAAELECAVAAESDLEAEPDVVAAAVAADHTARVGLQTKQKQTPELERTKVAGRLEVGCSA